MATKTPATLLSNTTSSPPLEYTNKYSQVQPIEVVLMVVFGLCGLLVLFLVCKCFATVTGSLDNRHGGSADGPAETQGKPPRASSRAGSKGSSARAGSKHSVSRAGSKPSLSRTGSAASLGTSSRGTQTSRGPADLEEGDGNFAGERHVTFAGPDEEAGIDFGTGDIKPTLRPSASTISLDSTRPGSDPAWPRPCLSRGGSALSDLSGGLRDAGAMRQPAPLPPGAVPASDESEAEEGLPADSAAQGAGRDTQPGRDEPSSTTSRTSRRSSTKASSGKLPAPLLPHAVPELAPPCWSQPEAGGAGSTGTVSAESAAVCAAAARAAVARSRSHSYTGRHRSKGRAATWDVEGGAGGAGLAATTSLLRLLAEGGGGSAVALAPGAVGGEARARLVVRQRSKSSGPIALLRRSETWSERPEAEQAPCFQSESSGPSIV